MPLLASGEPFLTQSVETDISTQNPANIESVTDK
jgi:hypothetical protein